jgi:predicted Rossmann fold nucleotide-binding protein DprA/Smf involved in DNA uptake
MQTLVGNPLIKAIYFGGASGSDTEALKAALYHRKGSRPRLIVLVPNTLENQPRETHEWSRKADELIELKRPITPEDGYLSYRKRNELLVDHGDLVIAFFNGDYKSGTGQAIRYAEKTGKKVYQINVSKE